MDEWRWSLKIMYNEIEIITRSGPFLFASFPRSLSYYLQFLGLVLEVTSYSSETRLERKYDRQ